MQRFHTLATEQEISRFDDIPRSFFKTGAFYESESQLNARRVPDGRKVVPEGNRAINHCVTFHDHKDALPRFLILEMSRKIHLRLFLALVFAPFARGAL